MVRKKPLLFLTLTALALFISKPVFAASCGGVETSIVSCDEGGSGGVLHILFLVLDIFSMGIGIAAVIGIAVAGTQYLISKGDSANTTKAKRRLYEIIIGVVCYAVLWAGLRWLLPNSSSSTANNNQQAPELSISFSGTAAVGKTFFTQRDFC